jgi:7-keto-8-aminopelargonate synthetase-like enzyme
MADLERQLKAVEKEAKRKGGPLKRRFIVSEGVFENNGAMIDLTKVVSRQCRLCRLSIRVLSSGCAG